MSNQNIHHVPKVLIYTYTLLTGTSLLFSSIEANSHTDVDVLSIDDAASCTQCTPCPVHKNIGDCNASYALNSLYKESIPTHISQCSAIHGLDVATLRI